MVLKVSVGEFSSSGRISPYGETVADTQHEAVAVLQQIVHRFGDARIPEHGGDELAAAVRLITGAEAARQHDDLGFFDPLHHRLDRFFDSLGRQVADDKNLTFRPCQIKGSSVPGRRE